MRFIGICLLSLSVAVSAVAGDIKAIVNDTPVSAFDVDARAKMMLFQRSGSVGKLTRSLRQEALDDLVDERLKMQEADKQGVAATPAEVADALANLEHQNGLPAGGFRDLLKKNKIPYETLQAQTAANLGWVRVMQRAGKTVTVGKADIQARKALIRRELNKDAISFAEIVLPTEEAALAVWQQVQEHPDTFGSQVALKSTADSRLDGGRVMNVAPDYYGPEFAAIVSQMQVGQMTRPVQIPGGYAIILLLNKRDAVATDTITVWDLAQAVVPRDSIAATLLQQPVKDGCAGFAEIVKDDALPGSFQHGQVNPRQLPPDIKPMLEDGAFQKVLGPMITPYGSLYFMKCGKHEERIVPTDEEIQAQVESDKMELVSRQMLSELKRDAVIEYK